jgi:hypothetical protein
MTDFSLEQWPYDLSNQGSLSRPNSVADSAPAAGAACAAATTAKEEGRAGLAPRSRTQPSACRVRRRCVPQHLLHDLRIRRRAYLAKTLVKKASVACAARSRALRLPSLLAPARR